MKHTPTLALLLCCLLSSCMTIFTSSSETIIINRDPTEPVTVVTTTDTLTTTSNAIEITIKKKDLNNPIYLTSDRHVYQPLIPGRRIDWVGAYFDLYSYGIGLIVDFSTGAIYHPKQKTYYVASAPCDSVSTSVLPLKDYHSPSVWKPREQPPYHHEVRLSIGVGNVLDKHCYQRMYNRACQSLGLEEHDTWYCGLGAVANFSANVSYFYHFNQRWAFGAIIGTGTQPYEELAYPSPRQRPDDDFHRQDYAGDMNATSCYFMPAAKWHWAFFKAARLYSKAGIGAMQQHNYFTACRPTPDSRQMDERRWHLAYQFSPIGVEVGSRWLRFFAELGYGMEGVLNMGWSCYF